MPAAIVTFLYIVSYASAYLGFTPIRSQSWYKRPETALDKAKDHIDIEIARSQIRDVIGWV